MYTQLVLWHREDGCIWKWRHVTFEARLFCLLEANSSRNIYLDILLLYCYFIFNLVIYLLLSSSAYEITLRPRANSQVLNGGCIYIYIYIYMPWRCSGFFTPPGFSWCPLICERSPSSSGFCWRKCAVSDMQNLRNAAWNQLSHTVEVIVCVLVLERLGMPQESSLNISKGKWDAASLVIWPAFVVVVVSLVRFWRNRLQFVIFLDRICSQTSRVRVLERVRACGDCLSVNEFTSKILAAFSEHLI